MKYPNTKATRFEVETKSLLATADFGGGSIFITIKKNDEDDETTHHITLDSSEELNDLAVLLEKINDLNLGE